VDLNMKRESYQSKLKSESSPAGIKGGGSGDGSGPTSSSRSYPKGSSVGMTPDFDPRKGKRSKTTIYVGGV